MAQIHNHFAGDYKKRMKMTFNYEKVGILSFYEVQNTIFRENIIIFSIFNANENK
jgi:hypothetical protein